MLSELCFWNLYINASSCNWDTACLEQCVLRAFNKLWNILLHILQPLVLGPAASLLLFRDLMQFSTPAAVRDSARSLLIQSFPCFVEYLKLSRLVGVERPGHSRAVCSLVVRRRNTGSVPNTSRGAHISTSHD